MQPFYLYPETEVVDQFSSPPFFFISKTLCGRVGFSKEGFGTHSEAARSTQNGPRVLVKCEAARAANREIALRGQEIHPSLEPFFDKVSQFDSPCRCKRPPDCARIPPSGTSSKSRRNPWRITERARTTLDAYAVSLVRMIRHDLVESHQNRC